MLGYVNGADMATCPYTWQKSLDGHDEATANRHVMEMWADVADAFIHDGAVLV